MGIFAFAFGETIILVLLFGTLFARDQSGFVFALILFGFLGFFRVGLGLWLIQGKR